MLSIDEFCCRGCVEGTFLIADPPCRVCRFRYCFTCMPGVVCDHCLATRVECAIVGVPDESDDLV